jgi:TPR repeat protein
VFDTDTPIEIVIMTLQAWGLEPVVGRRTVVVREGPSSHNMGVREASHVVYGFNKGILTMGPLHESELVDVFIDWNLSLADYESLLGLDEVAPLSAAALNNMAWALSTYHDESRRAPSVALELAVRANERSDWSNAAHLDTLAAAYAANGEFRHAAVHQQWAITVADETDPGMSDRLGLYLAGNIYVEPEPAGGPTDDVATELHKKAMLGDAAAQFDLAAYAIENGIGKYDDIVDPGRHFLTLAADQGEVRAIETIGYALLRGEYGWDADPVAAQQWLLKSDALGSELASYNLAIMFRDGIGVERDDAEATRWLRRAADRGLALAAVEVAYRYWEGVGVESSPDIAEKYFAQAAAGDVGPLQSMYGEDDFFFEEVISDDALEALPDLVVQPKDFPRHLLSVVVNMEQELERGQAYVTARLPDSYAGWDLQDAAFAKFLLTRAAANFGSRQAQNRLAELYESGDGVDASPGEAKYWRSRATKNDSGL